MKEREIDKIEHVEIGGKEMRLRKPVNYNEDYDADFFDGSMSEERSHLQRKRNLLFPILKKLMVDKKHKLIIILV